MLSYKLARITRGFLRYPRSEPSTDTVTVTFV